MPSGRTHHRLSAAAFAGLMLACLALGFTGAGQALADDGPHEHGLPCPARLASDTTDGSQPALHQPHGHPAGGAGWRASSQPAADVRPAADVLRRSPAPLGSSSHPSAPPKPPVRVLYGVWLN